MSLNVSHSCWLIDTLFPSAMKLLHVSHCLQWLLSVSYCLSGSM